MIEQEEKSWFQKYWWLFPSSCFGLVACCVIFFVGIFALVGIFIRNSDIYADSMEVLNSNPRAVELLGEPIESGFFITGNLTTEGTNGQESGFADLSIPVSGPRGSGDLTIVATKWNDGWNYDQFELVVDDSGETINLKDR